MPKGEHIYLAEITNGCELGAEFLGVTKTLEEAKKLVEKYNVDMGVVSSVEMGRAYPDGPPQTYWRYEEGAWQLWNTNDGPVEEEENGDDEQEH